MTGAQFWHVLAYALAGIAIGWPAGWYSTLAAIRFHQHKGTMHDHE